MCYMLHFSFALHYIQISTILGAVTKPLRMMQTAVAANWDVFDEMEGFERNL